MQHPLWLGLEPRPTTSSEWPSHWLDKKWLKTFQWGDLDKTFDGKNDEVKHKNKDEQHEW